MRDHEVRARYLGRPSSSSRETRANHGILGSPSDNLGSRVSSSATRAGAIVLPIIAGRLFDLTQGYGTAVLIAGCGNALGILVALGLPKQRSTAGSRRQPDGRRQR